MISITPRVLLCLALAVSPFVSQAFNRPAPRGVAVNRQGSAAVTPFSQLSSRHHGGGSKDRRGIDSSLTCLHAFPSLPLIPKDDNWGNWAVLAGTASLAQYLGKSSKIGKLLGAPVTAMACTFALATIGVLNPGGSPPASALQVLSLQLATPLVLLGADLRDALRRCGPLLVSFLVASLATLVACLAGWPLLGSSLQSALGQDGLVIAAALMAKNIGGGLNCEHISVGGCPSESGRCVRFDMRSHVLRNRFCT